MKVYRLTHELWKLDVSGKGGEIEIGRWHRTKIPIMYASESLTLAACEVIMHEDFLPTDKFVQEFNFSRDQVCTLKQLNRINKDLNIGLDWKKESSDHMRELIRLAWMGQTQYPALKVPTVITPGEFNILIRPGDDVTLSSTPRAYHFDSRFAIQPSIQYTNKEKSEIKKQLPLEF